MSAPARTKRASTTRATTRAIIYIRQSTAKEESISLENQETSGREYCARNGYAVVAVIVDEGYSGRRWDNRPGVQKALGLIQSGDAEALIVWRWSRLARNRLHFAVANDRVETLGGTVESALEPVDSTTASGRFQRGMLGEFAAFQSDMIGESWKEAHDNRRRRGLPATGGRRYGYTRVCPDGEEERYEPDERAETLRWMYQAYIDGHGNGGIARMLNASGIPNNIGRRWLERAVQETLDSGFGAGLITRSAYHQGQQLYRRVSDRIWLPGAQEPVIDDDTWYAYLDTRERRTHYPPRSANPSHILGGLVRCGDDECGRGPMNRREVSKLGTFTCVNRSRIGIGRPCNVMESRVHQILLDWLAELADDVGHAAERARQVEQAQLRVRTDAEAARREIDRIDDQLAELTRQLVAGRVPEAAYDTARDDLMRDRADVERRIALADTRHTQTPAHVIARGLLDEWETLPTVECREVISSLVECVEITPGAPNSSGKGRSRASIRIIPKWNDAGDSLGV